MSPHIPENATPKRPLVLLVVTTEERRKELAYHLRTSGMDSIAAHKGREALILSARAKPEVLLIDAGIRTIDSMNAVEILQAIHKDAGSVARVVVMESRSHGLTPAERNALAINRYLADDEVTPAGVVDAVKSLVAS